MLPVHFFRQCFRGGGECLLQIAEEPYRLLVMVGGTDIEEAGSMIADAGNGFCQRFPCLQGIGSLCCCLLHTIGQRNKKIDSRSSAYRYTEVETKKTAKELLSN